MPWYKHESLTKKIETSTKKVETSIKKVETSNNVERADSDEASNNEKEGEYQNHTVRQNLILNCFCFVGFLSNSNVFKNLFNLLITLWKSVAYFILSYLLILVFNNHLKQIPFKFNK